MFMVAAALAMTPAAATTSQSGGGFNQSPWERTYIYYSDDTYTTQVGQYVYHCDGSISRWGQISLYHEEQFFTCP